MVPMARPRREIELICAQDVPAQERLRGRAKIYKLLPDKIRGLGIDRIELDRGAHMPGHAHLKGTKEYLTLIEGEMTLHTSNSEMIVRVGNVLAFAGDQPHAYRNSGSTKAVAISVVIPMLD